jgi:AraC-like DNA-binding protein
MEYGLETLIGKSMSEPLVFDAKMYADIGSSSAWWRTIRYIETELLNADSLYNSPAFIRDIEQALIKGILTLQPHNYSDEIKQEVHKKLPAYLIKVIEYLKVNARHEIDIDDIEELSGVSISKLYSDFKRYIGMPPTAYLKRLRLEGVRADTMKCMGEENISTLAFSWGFNHLGRFSTEYRKMFGETPSQTQAKIKARLKL